MIEHLADSLKNLIQHCRRQLTYSARRHKFPKTTSYQFFDHNFLCKTDKDTKFGSGVLHSFSPHFLNSHVKIIMFSTSKILERISVLLVYFIPQFFGTVGLSADFLVELKLDIVKTKLSTVKHLQFYLSYSRLFENKGDEKSVEPQCGWL